MLAIIIALGGFISATATLILKVVNYCNKKKSEG